MHEPRGNICSIRRLAVVTFGALLLAGAGAPAALADLGLSEQTASLPSISTVGPAEWVAPSEIAETPALVPDAVGQTVASRQAEDLTADVFAQATEPAVEAGQQTQLLPTTVATLTEVTESTLTPVGETLPAAAAEPVLQHAALLLETAPVLDAVGETTPPTADVVEPVLRLVQPIVETATPAVAPASGSVQRVVYEALPNAASAPEPSFALPAPISSDRIEHTAPMRRAPATAPTGSGSLGLGSRMPPRVSGGFLDIATSGDTKASPPSSSTPAPFAPGGPPSGLASAFASAGTGALVLLLAALAAALVLAAPGLGRRLRPRLAPWPQPILQLSLERPG